MAKEKNLTNVTSVAAADFARVVTSAGASVKATFANVAKYIVETYNGSTVAGSAQSVKSALDSLNSKTTTVKYFNQTVSSGFVRLSYPTGYSKDNIYIIQPVYSSGGVLGWSATIQTGASDIVAYIRQGSSTPADGSTISFYLICIK